ncbi:MAG: ABC transporter ATP-binding protein [Actinomycetota bacterium]|nr:ABC transporter ATP-binding protein [Actinomycetota bacterium]
MPSSDNLLKVKDLRTYFHTEDGTVRAVDGVSFEVKRGETLGIVGESGSGKTVTALAVVGLLPAKAQVTGEVRFRGRDLRELPEPELRAMRGSSIGIVPQDALAALNPLHRVGTLLAEAIRTHHPVGTRRAVDGMVQELLTRVGIPNPAARTRQYPHEFSGGMRQRVMIAMAIANDPALLIADEPTTALDVTTQAQVLEVLGKVRARSGSAMILITHDLGVVAGVVDRMLVMYAGRVVESGTVAQVFKQPSHPYTVGLLASLPRLDGDRSRRLSRIPGQPPSLVDVPAGCAFHPRCAFARTPAPCATEEPSTRAGSGLSHVAACHFVDEVVAAGAAKPATG